MVLIGIRVLYALIALTTRRPSLNPVTGSIAVRVVLSFLPELITTLLFIVAGWRTRNLIRARTDEHVRLESRGSRRRRH
jgi:hypothetical protein